MELLSRRALHVGALYGLLSVIFCLPLFAQPLGLGIADWDQHLFYYAEVLKSVVEYGQLPFWSPWYCGGNVIWQNPQVALLSPAYVLTAVLPLALAMKVNIVLHYWIGFAGMHRLLTRVVRVTFLPLVVYAASIFTLGGSLALHFAMGHSVFLPAFYLPWLLYFLHRAFQTDRYRPALAAAAILALFIYNGGLHIVPMALLAIAGLAVGTALIARDWRPLAFALVVGVYGAAFAAPKLLPIAEFVASDRFIDARNPTDHPERMTGEMMWRAYTDASLGADSRIFGEQRHGWWEYGNYIGAIGAIAIGIGLVWPLAVRSMPGRPFAAVVALIALSFLVLSAGEFHPFAPSLGLARLPLFALFRIPSRFTIPFVLFGALAIGAAGRHIVGRWLTTERRRFALALLCAIGIANLIFVNRKPFANTFSQPPLHAGFTLLAAPNHVEPDAAIDPYAPNAPMLRALMSNRGVHNCYEPLQLIRGADVARPLIWSEGGAAVSGVVFTPNRVQFSVIGGFQRSKVFLNQNFAPGWRSTAGPVLLDPSTGGKMYVELPPGHTGTYVFSFVPLELGTGLALLFVAVAASALVWNRRLTPVAIPLASARAKADSLPFAARAERGTKVFILVSIAAAVIARGYVAGVNQVAFIEIAGISFAIAWAISSRWESAAGVVLATTFVAPALFSRVWIHDPNAYPIYMTAGLLGAMWPRWSLRQWSLPRGWRVPLVGWALVTAVAWPIIALREVDFHPELPELLNLPASTIGLSAAASIAITAEAAALVMLGIVWLDWLFQHYTGDRERFRRVLVMPLLIGGSVASIVAAYQLFGDITFLNSGWAEFRRASATMMDANGFGIAAVLCGCGFLACIEGRRSRWNVLMIGGFALSLVGTWASGSKTALVAEMIALAFLAKSMVPLAGSGTHAPRRHRGRLLALAAAGIAIAAVLFALRNTGPALRLGWVLPSASLDSFANFTRMLWDRAGYGRAALEMIRSHPWFGVGVGSFPLIAGDYSFSHLGGPLAPDNAQNWIRHYLAELGLIGSLGWIVWAVVVANAVFRRSPQPRDSRTTIVGGGLVGVIVVSQVGMPTQNAAVAIIFWTFLFWYFADRWPSVVERRPAASWQWGLMTAAVVVFVAGTLETSLTTLRTPMRARRAGWSYGYGFQHVEHTASGQEYRWTKQYAVAVVPVPSRLVTVTVWVNRRDLATHPVMARVWHDQTLVVDTVFHDNQPVSADVIIDHDPQQLMVRTYLDRTLPESSPPDLGLAVQWTSLDPQSTNAATSIR